MSKSLRLVVVDVLAIFLLSVSMLAQQAPPSADTFVSSATPTINYGSSIVDVVGSGTTTYMKFNLSGIPAGPFSRTTAQENGCPISRVLCEKGGYAGPQFRRPVLTFGE